MPKFDHDTIMLAFVIVTAVAVLFQAVILFAIFIAVSKTAKSLRNEVESIRSSVMPIILTTRELILRLTPKVEETVGDVAAVARGVRVRTEDAQATAAEILGRVRNLSGRLDVMFTAVLDAVDRAGGLVAELISKPAKQMSVVLASLRSILDSLRSEEAPFEQPHGEGTHATEDYRHFEG